MAAQFLALATVPFQSSSGRAKPGRESKFIVERQTRSRQQLETIPSSSEEDKFLFLLLGVFAIVLMVFGVAMYALIMINPDWIHQTTVGP